MTTITLKTSDVEATISVPKDDMTFEEMIADLVKPILIAIGHSPKLVDELGDY